jgi:hypothetical protein
MPTPTPMDLTSLTTAVTSVKVDALDVLAAVAPLAIAVMGAFLVWKLGVRFFKGLAK